MKTTKHPETYEEVCKIKGIDPVKSLPYPNPQNDEEEAINCFARTIRTIEVINKGKRPDWNDGSKLKLQPWFDMRNNAGSGVGFSYLGYYYDRSISVVGSRLVLHNSADVKHVTKHFLKDYEGFMTFKEE